MTVSKNTQEDLKMHTKRPLYKRIRLVYRRSSTTAKVIVLAAIILSTAALLTLRGAIQDANAEAQALRDQASQLEQEQNKLQENINGLGSLNGIEQIAKDELGLVNPDTIIIEPQK